jgi:hypothetical protein
MWSTGMPLPVAMSAYALATFEGKLYVFGGWDGMNYLDDVFMYDPAQEIWIERSPMPTARAYAGAAEAGGKIYVIGGYDGEEGLPHAEIFQPGLNEDSPQIWEIGPSLPYDLFGMGTISVADIIYIISGKTEEVPYPISLEYVPQQGHWQSIGTPFYIGTKPGFAYFDLHIYIFGGLINNKAISTSYSYQTLYRISIPVIR